MRRAALGLAAAAALAACGKNGSTLSPELSEQLAAADKAAQAGDVAGYCDALRASMPMLDEWMTHQRGNRAGQAAQLMARSDSIVGPCMMPGPARAGTAVPSDWSTWYKELRASAELKTGWLTVFTYVSMFGLGAFVFWLLRRLRN
jgi:hypothetical protein